MQGRGRERSGRRVVVRMLMVASSMWVVASCGGDSTDAGSPTTPAVEPTPAPSGSGEVTPTGEVVEVTAIDNTFRPERVEVRVGDEVVWVNGGRNEHDVLTVEGDDWGVTVDDFQPGDEYRHVFTEPGEYAYYCSVHGTAEVGMIGTVVVSG